MSRFILILVGAFYCTAAFVIIRRKCSCSDHRDYSDIVFIPNLMLELGEPHHNDVGSCSSLAFRNNSKLPSCLYFFKGEEKK